MAEYASIIAILTNLLKLIDSLCINQILEELGGALYLTALDLLHGFYNLEITPGDRWKTAFSTPMNLFACPWD